MLFRSIKLYSVRTDDVSSHKKILLQIEIASLRFYVINSDLCCAECPVGISLNLYVYFTVLIPEILITSPINVYSGRSSSGSRYVPSDETYSWKQSNQLTPNTNRIRSTQPTQKRFQWFRKEFEKDRQLDVELYTRCLSEVKRKMEEGRAKGCLSSH